MVVIDDEFILRVDRFRDDLDSLNNDIRRRYKRDNRVGASGVRESAAKLAEIWMVEIASRDDVKNALDDGVFADLSVEFQRLLRYAEQSIQRKKYDDSLRRILRDFRANVVIPLKQAASTSADHISAPRSKPTQRCESAFVGHSFGAQDRSVVQAVITFLQKSGITVVTGEKARANYISDKIKGRIEQCDAFCGLFTRQEKISGKSQWTASPWIIDEKAFALAKEKKLILLKEEGVLNIGGLQGDYEYLEFSRDNLLDLMFRLMDVFRVRASGLASD